jgi:uncharacterized delta-60 repeat protein
MKYLLTIFGSFFIGILQAQVPCSLDNSFATNGKLVADGSRMGESVLVQNDGKIIIACNAFGNGQAYLKRLNIDGSIDNSYGIGGMCQISYGGINTDITDMKFFGGNLYLCGTNSSGNNTYVIAAAVSPTGTLINSFGAGGYVNFDNAGLYTCSALCVDATGKIYITGAKSFSELFVLKLNSNGSVDNSFDTDGIQTISTNNNNQWIETADIDIDKDGKILIAGKKYKANNGNPDPPFWNILVARFNSDGSLDNGFATGGFGLFNSNAANFDESRRILILPSGDYIVCGATYDGVDYDYTVVKLKNNGVVDNTFGNGGWFLHDLEYINDMEYLLNAALLPDGRILMTGNQGDGDTVYFSLLMLKPDGTRDVQFAPNGLYKNIFNQNNNSSSSGMGLTSDGKIVLAGYTRTCANGTCGPLYLAVSRYFGGTPTTPNALNEVTEESDIILYPNPAMKNQELFLYVPSQAIVLDVKVIGMDGNFVCSLYDRQRNCIKILAPVSGNYFCRIQTIQGILTKRISIE